MCILLFVLHVCMLRECEGDGNTGVEDGGCVVVLGTVPVDITRGSGIVSSTADVLGMSVVRGMRAVGGVCEMCMFFPHLPLLPHLLFLPHVLFLPMCCS